MTKIYRWIKLSEALNIMVAKHPKKFTYRITDVSETQGYARHSKIWDRDNKGAIIEADLDMWHIHIVKDIKDFHNKKLPFYRDHIWVYKTSKFNIFLIPPSFSNAIKNPKIIEIV
jgi:hypothetical protein